MGFFSVFRKNFAVRRFDEEIIAHGHSFAGYHDFSASLNVAPDGSQQLQALPEGERNYLRLKVVSDIPLQAASEQGNCRGDMIFYHGKWFICKSCVSWEHTIVRHFNSDFVEAHAVDSSTYAPPEDNVQDDCVFYVDEDGNYLVDDEGNFLVNMEGKS